MFTLLNVSVLVPMLVAITAEGLNGTEPNPALNWVRAIRGGTCCVCCLLVE